MKGYNIDSTSKEKVLNVFNNEYGFNLKKEKIDITKEYFKPRNNVNSKELTKKG